MIFKRKCRFINKCPFYREGDRTCEEDAGQYYGINRYPGCYIQMEEKEVKHEKYIRNKNRKGYYKKS